MQVTTITATVRFSKQIADGVFKTVELGCEATPGLNEPWEKAQASLYQQLGQQIKALWNGGGQASNDGSNPTPEHYCQDHATDFKRFEKDRRVWFSNRTAEGKWCREK